MKNFFTKQKSIITALISGFLIISSVQFGYRETDDSALFEKYYLENLLQLKNVIVSIKNKTLQKNKVESLKDTFYKARLTYKKLAVLTDYFNQYETKSLNGPPISRIESEVADKIIPPEGFQAIEELLFSNKWNDSNYGAIVSLLEGMEQVLQKLDTEPDKEYKFKDELVWDAMRSAIVQLITTGISGFDSPTANNSLPEAVATIEGIKNLLAFFKPVIEKKQPEAYSDLISCLNKSIGYLQKNNQFNKFDRLQFITTYINPFYKLLTQTRITSGIGIPEGRSAINYNSLSIFNEDALDINFYSPPKEYWVSPERIALGKLLFSDPILSGTHTRSCASCHQPEKAFTDGLATPYALDNKTLLPRNTPTLWNSGFQTKQFYDSRADILENQLSEVVHNEEEMKGSMKESVSKLKELAQYVSLFKQAYPTEKIPINTFTIANAISIYVRSLRSLNSPFDQYMRGDKTKLSKGEKKGFNLFMGKAKCATCHFMPLFNGVVPPSYSETESEVIGVPASKNKNPAVLDGDLGKYTTTHSTIHKYAFKTPTLRNIALTAPYMHNGVYNTLEEVMEFYNNGGGKGLHIAPPNQTLPFDKLNLNKKEIKQIIAFMLTLTDTATLK